MSNPRPTALGWTLLLAVLYCLQFGRCLGAQTYVKSVGGAGRSAEVAVLKSSPDGSVFVAGKFTGTNSVIEASLAITPAGKRTNAFVGRIGSNGDWLWAEEFSGVGVRVLALAPAFDRVYVGVVVNEGSLSFKGKEVYMTVTGGAFGMVLGLSLDGQTILDQAVIAPRSGSPTDIITDLAVRRNGNLVVAGNYQSSLLGFTAGTDPSLTLPSVYTNTVDMFVAEYSADKKWLWATNAGGPGDDHLSAIAVDAGNGIYVTGKTSGKSIYNSKGTAYIPDSDSDDFAVMVQLGYDNTPLPGLPAQGRVARTINRASGEPARFGRHELRSGLVLAGGPTPADGFVIMVDQPRDYLELRGRLNDWYRPEIANEIPVESYVLEAFPELIPVLTPPFITEDLSFTIWGQRYLGSDTMFVAKLDASDAANRWTAVQGNPAGVRGGFSEAYDIEFIDNQVVIAGGFRGSLNEFDDVTKNWGRVLGIPPADSVEGLALRLTSGLAWDKAVTLRSPSPQDRFRSVAAGPAGETYLLGRFGNEAQLDPRGNAPETLTASNPNLLLTRLSPDFTVEWAARIGTNEIPASVEERGVAVMKGSDRLLIGGHYSGGTLEFPGRVDSLPDSNGSEDPEGFVVGFNTEPQSLAVEVELEVVSDFGKAYVTPYVGRDKIFAGTSVKVSAPARIYVLRVGVNHYEVPQATEEESFQDAVKGIVGGTSAYSDVGLSNTIVQLLTSGPGGITTATLNEMMQNDPASLDALIETKIFPTVVSRYRNRGFNLNESINAGTANRIDLTVTRETRLKFNWQIEHALDVDSQEVAMANTSPLQRESLNALGGPQPAVNRHWIVEGTEVAASVDGVVISPEHLDGGTRFAVIGYEGLGAAPSSAPSGFGISAGRIQIGGINGFFRLTEPSRITWKWQRQHRVQISTTSGETSHLPAIAEGSSDSLSVKNQGSGEFWYSRGQALSVGAPKEDTVTGKQLVGWMNASGRGDLNDYFPFPIYPPINETGDLGLVMNSTTIGGKSYWMRSLGLLMGPVGVTWNFGDLVTYFNVAIGDSLGGTPVHTNLTSRAPKVTVVDGPPGSTPDQMLAWDAVRRLALPLRPGICLLEWETTGSGNTLGRVITQVTSGFPGEPISDYPGNPSPKLSEFPGSSHFRHVAGTPPVDLDSSGTNDTKFLRLAYSTGDGRVSEERNFRAEIPGKSVLVFSAITNPPGVAASGDLSREPLKVRVVETRRWNGTAWSVQNPKPADASETPLLKRTGSSATVGALLPATYATTLPGRGFILFQDDDQQALYNRSIYQSEPPPSRIYPVNRWRVATKDDPLDEDRDLVVVWYENRDDILWPYQPERFNQFQWPTDPPAKTPTAPGGRIVIASRLGSEGMTARGGDGKMFVQVAFQPERYEQVSIYNQPDPSLPGYNPNEEHALIVPSFRFRNRPNPPPAAYALRNDLNITTNLIQAGVGLTDANYTSEPYVLVQYFDLQQRAWDMAVYAVEREDPEVGSERSGAELKSELLVRGLPGIIRDVNVVLDLDVPTTQKVRVELMRTNGDPAVRLIDDRVNLAAPDGTGSVFAAVRFDDEAERGFGDVLSPPYSGSVRPVEFSETVPIKGLAAFKNQLPEGTWRLVIRKPDGSAMGSEVSLRGWSLEFVLEKDDALVREVVSAANRSEVEFPYVFRYDMKAGEPVMPPYPLDRVIGVMPCLNPVDARGTPLDPPQGTSYEAGAGGQRTYWTDHRGQGWAISGDSYFFGRFFYPLRPEFWYPFTLDGDTAPAPLVKDVGDCVPFLPAFDLGAATAKLGVYSADPNPKERQTPQRVQLNTRWPEDLPVLKVGETLTFSGGEYRQDFPSAPGLPGVVGWSAGEIVYDSQNPTSANGPSFATNLTTHLARLASPLLDRRVPLTQARFPDALRPASKRTRVKGSEYVFDELSASLQRRVFYDFLSGELGLRGSLADRRLGDADLTAAPPPNAILEPNILTADEKAALLGLSAESAWVTAVNSLFQLTRNPSQIQLPGAGDLYLVGVGADIQRDDDGNPKLDAAGHPMPDHSKPIQPQFLGPGLALVPNHAEFNPDFQWKVTDYDYAQGRTRGVGYLTLAENNDPVLGAAPVQLHIIKIDPERRYRGFVKTIRSDNAFDEKITLRHSGDFGARADDLVFQWWLREEDGTEALLPGQQTPDSWQLFGRSGAGRFQVDLAGVGSVILRDNRVFARYRHRGETTRSEIDWTGSNWERFGAEWAGAVNSPDVNGKFRPALVPGWVKRVLDAVNPFEARLSEIGGDITSPASYASMIQQAGERYEGPVAFNPDKDVIENVGLIGLYQTVLDRASDLTINLSQPVNTPGVLSALQLAATRVSDFYMLLGNEAYADAQDPTIGKGSDRVGGGSLPPVSFAFQNQLPNLLEEELALLRGGDDTFGRPVYNRLLWNFTKSSGEADYTLSYNIHDVTQDGFINELDAQRLFPQGHGDAWGHYLSAVRLQYDLLRHPYFNWQSRSEFYSLNDVVFAVDFLDERRFAQAAAAKAKAGAEIVNLTYRSHYVEDPDGQWQGYRDRDPERAWGVTEWAKRAGQGALFDWLTANAMVPAVDTTRTGIAKVDRSTLMDIAEISAQLGALQSQYDGANNGLDPLGLTREVVPFDIDPNFNEVGSGIQGMVHFEQVYERAVTALANASTAFEIANASHQDLRQVADSTEDLRREVLEQDLDFRNRLIEIFGSPYDGTVGPGKVYPASYQGPDLLTFQYVDVSAVSRETVTLASESFKAAFSSFKSFTADVSGTFQETFAAYFLADVGGQRENFIDPAFFSPTNLQVELPLAKDTYAFARPEAWGIRRSPGELQVIISDLIQAEADAALALRNYETYVAGIADQLAMIRLRYKTSAGVIGALDELNRELRKMEGSIIALGAAINAWEATIDLVVRSAEAAAEIPPKVTGTASDVTSPIRAGSLLAGALAAFGMAVGETATLGLAQDTLEQSLKWLQREADLEIQTAEMRYELAQQLVELKQELRNEVTARLEIFKLAEALRQLGDQYRAKLSEGFRLIEERRNFNRKIAALTQQNRVQDLTFRITRNQALSQYRASFDLAARYAYLAAKAYDYETNLSPEDRGSAGPLLETIVRARDLGAVADGRPVVGLGGLADALGRMRDNFAVLKTQLGLNNPQFETGGFSLRRELLRIRKSDGALLSHPEGESPRDDELDRVVQEGPWRDQLARWRVDDLWAVPEFRRFCRPFAAHDARIPEPGLVIPFHTEIRAGRNFFGWPLGAGDNAYDSTLFATKIQAAGVWFENYDTSRLAKTPRVYLVPAGLDILTVPTRLDLQTREWNVVDQSIPVPYQTSAHDLVDPRWIPLTDSLSGPLAEIRRYSSFLAYPYTGETADDQFAYNTRLIGRSVWNTQWLLIIPGRTLLGDPDEALAAFIGREGDPGVSDIRILFQTYGYSGN